MDLIANEKSIHQQFHDLPTFLRALEVLMRMRSVAHRFGRTVHCQRAFLHTEPLSDLRMQQVAQHLPRDQRRALMAWLTRDGPFWDDDQSHVAGDWLECRGEIVTETGIGEAAYRRLHGIECSLISAVPSSWDCSPIDVVWNREAEELANRKVSLENWRDPVALEAKLQVSAAPPRSWSELYDSSKARFHSLTFSKCCFDALSGVPFAKCTADRILVLLNILDRLADAFDSHGARTTEGNELLRDYFTGSNALFSDSSDSEKAFFSKDLTFPHPDGQIGETLFCAWHGKVRHQTLRLHFSWPIRARQPLYIVYVGPKLTK